MDERDRGLQTAESRDHDRGGRSALRVQPPQESGAVQARHHEVGNHDLGGEGGQLLDRLLAVGGRLRLVSPRGDHGGQAQALVLLVVHDQHPHRAGGLLVCHGRYCNPRAGGCVQNSRTIVKLGVV